ncbi:transcriptional regulator domain-containing protein [Rhodophyticola porphyridii]|uniref:transcriptional regulator domain-containing protein n=1 Tax=Rhodophyticola porphyridii TaxID=1852017 RepID=UPI0035D0CB3A
MLEEKMVLNRNQWRSDAAYDYLDDLDTEGLAWECLRRNADYQSDYAARKTGVTDSSAVDDLIRQNWGLRFRNEPTSLRTRRNRLLGSGNQHRARHAHTYRIRDRKSDDRTPPA